MKLKVLAMTAMMMVMAKQASAYTACVGETYTKKIVIVEITTSGTVAQASSGLVTIVEADGTKTSYKLARNELVQYFEGGDTNTAMVGLAAYQAMNNPIWIMYKGINYHGDLVAVLRDPARVKQPGNEMRVWRGPGFPADQQSQFTDVICSFSLDQ